MKPFDPSAYDVVADSRVGMTEYDKPFVGFEPVVVDPELCIEFAETAIQMEWDEMTMYVRHDRPVFAHEYGDDFGMYLTLAPYLERDDS